MHTQRSITRWVIAAAIALLAAGPALAKGTVTIPPSYDLTGQTDYENIQTALLEATPNTLIQLEAGTYYLNHVLFVDDFRGVFRGAGKDLTIITSVGTLEAWNQGEFLPWLYPPSLEYPWPGVITFVDGRFTLSDMTFQVTEYIPMVAEFYGMEFELMGAMVYILGGEANGPVRSTIKRVGFEGAPGTWGGYNVVQAVYYSGIVGENLVEWGIPLTGRHVVRDSSFEHFETGIVVYRMDETARVTLTDNTMFDVTNGLGALDTSGRVEFSRNDVSVHPSEFGGDGAGVKVDQGLFSLLDGLPTLEPATIILRHNTFLVEDGFAGLNIQDWQYAELDAPSSLQVTALQNEFELVGAWDGVYTYGLVRPQLVQNVLYGDVLNDGLCLELTAKGRVVLNDMQQLEAGNKPCLLMEDTFDNRLIAVNAWDDVLDLTDDPLTPEYDGLNFIIEIGGGTGN